MLPTLFQVHVVCVLVEVIAAHGAVELVVRVHLVGVWGWRCGESAGRDAGGVPLERRSF